MSREWFLGSLAFAIVLAALAIAVPVSAQIESPRFGRLGLSAPERTDAGDWYGTWFYVSRTRKMAMWIREEDGEPRLKLRLEERYDPKLSFTTEWNSKVAYTRAGLLANFELEIEQADENTIAGRWVWKTRTDGAGRTELADFTIYRTGWGRQFVWKFENARQENVVGGAGAPVPEEYLWTFRKASRRQALWAELPF
jgi:hypothetical protein